MEHSPKRPEHPQDRLAELTRQGFEQKQSENPVDDTPEVTTEPETPSEQGEQ